jgi:hypothetical protein
MDSVASSQNEAFTVSPCFLLRLVGAAYTHVETILSSAARSNDMDFTIPAIALAYAFAILIYF